MYINDKVSLNISDNHQNLYYLDTEFVNVDGKDISNRVLTIDNQGKFLTFWISQTTNQLSNSSSSSATTASEGTSDTDSISDNYSTT